MNEILCLNGGNDSPKSLGQSNSDLGALPQSGAASDDTGGKGKNPLINFLREIQVDEHLNVIGRPRKRQLLDFTGITYGGIVLFQALTGKVPQRIMIAMGFSMLWIHSRRFFFAPQTQRELT